MNFSDYMENFLADGLFRGGAMNLSGAVGSTAVVKGLWTASIAYVVGDKVVPVSNTTAGGKFLVCTTAGTSGATFTTALGNPGATVADNTVTWTIVSGMPSPLKLYAALLNINKGLRANSIAYSVGDCISLTPTGGVNGDTRQHVYRCTTAGTSAAAQPGTYLGAPGEVITDNTAVFTEISPVMDTNTGFPAGLAEVTGGSYARVSMAAGAAMALADFAGTQAAASTTASTGTGGTTSNNAAVTFPTPTANWATGGVQCGILGIYDALTGGNLAAWGPLTVPKTVNNGDPAPAIAISALTFQIDN